MAFSIRMARSAEKEALVMCHRCREWGVGRVLGGGGKLEGFWGGGNWRGFGGGVGGALGNFEGF